MLQHLRLKLKNYTSVHWMAYAIFTAFLILDGFFYLLSPYSGRISRLDCKPDSAVQSTCTVTIYGFRQVYRRSFTADQFIEALLIHNYTGDSADTTYGITLLTTAGKINFIHPYQPRAVVEQKVNQINDLFVDAVPATDASLTHVGFNNGLYLRLLLVVAGALFLLHRNSRIKQKTQHQPAPSWSFGRFLLHWFRNNLLVRLFFYLVILTIIVTGCTNPYSPQTDLVMGCYYIPQARQRFFDPAWGYLLCFFPLLSILLLKALVQRQMLCKVNISTTAWWLLAPLAGAPLLVAIAPHLYCDDCLTMKYLFIGAYDPDSPLLVGLVVYLVGIGLIQWLALRKNLAGSYGWVLMPLINAMLVVLVMMGYYAIKIPYWKQLSSYQRQISIHYYEFYLPVLIILVWAVISEIIPALYISWVVKRRKAAATVVG